MNKIADWDLQTNSTDWVLNITEQEDYYSWHPTFTAIHSYLGKVEGNEDGSIDYYPRLEADLNDLKKCFEDEISVTLDWFDPGEI
jgi:hypothetical protein